LTARINVRRADEVAQNVAGVTEVNDFVRAGNVDPRGPTRLDQRPGGSLRLAAANPVFVLAGQREAR